ncbi:MULTISPECIES: hypothetical protein [Gammaproteobacteria]|uniref:Uncharacterized protein n=1 Tax=Pseudoalteromonas caenipelagi TaxID=2726988 RepID=A0A849VNA9_9GAMM|nr:MULTISPECIES: hypothetical protein [Gammaproteobacteria]MDF4578534.1 hypothetical protein [Vibrio parahaemolyticus]MDW1789109.1 hypothetical protein [Vibrio sp. Vb2227]MDW1802757.1 hypothetical protein [Vibrio sp. Vb2201]MDW1848863.1 hypothetical protein [Vibrio sp. Vb2130]NOU53194.1 hypothetical protein [Pseudoalteromonas caenipelagi]
MAYDTLDVLPSGQFTVNTPPIDVNGKSLLALLWEHTSLLTSMGGGRWAVSQAGHLP